MCRGRSENKYFKDVYVKFVGWGLCGFTPLCRVKIEQCENLEKIYEIMHEK